MLIPANPLGVALEGGGRLSVPLDTAVYTENLPDVTGLSAFMPNGIVAIATSNSGYVTYESRSWTKILATPPASIRLLISATVLVAGGEAPMAKGVTVQAALERSASALTVPFTFKGKQKAFLKPGQTIMSDPLFPADFGLSSFAANTTYYTRVSETIAETTGQYANYVVASGRPSTAAGEYVRSFNPPGSTQVYATGALTTQAGGSSSFRAMTHLSLIGTWDGTPLPSLLYMGDRIYNGSNDGNWVSSGTGGGFAVRGVQLAKTNGIPAIHSARSTSVQPGIAALTAINLRSWLARLVTHVMEGFGADDVASGVSAASIYAAKKAFYAACRVHKPGVKIIATTIGPRTTSSDSWATGGNQTPVAGFENGGICDQLNTLINSEVGGAGPDHVIDTRAAISDLGDLHLWRSDGVANKWTSDGVLPNSTPHAAMGTLVRNFFDAL